LINLINKTKKLLLVPAEQDESFTEKDKNMNTPMNTPKIKFIDKIMRVIKIII